MPKTESEREALFAAKAVAREKRIDEEQRIAFGITWFASEEDAQAYSAAVRACGVTYNGGWFHGMPCGRETRFDRKDADGNVTAFAVTD